jgi:hypothetical protein
LAQGISIYLLEFKNLLYLSLSNGICKILLSIVEHSTNRNSIPIHEKVPREEETPKDENNIVSLYNAWNLLLEEKPNPEAQISAAVPRAPHLEDCEMNTQRNLHHDNRAEDGGFPDWIVWNRSMGHILNENSSSELQISEQKNLGPNPPWVCHIKIRSNK